MKRHYLCETGDSYFQSPSCINKRFPITLKYFSSCRDKSSWEHFIGEAWETEFFKSFKDKDKKCQTCERGLKAYYFNTTVHISIKKTTVESRFLEPSFFHTSLIITRNKSRFTLVVRTLTVILPPMPRTIRFFQLILVSIGG